MQKRRLRSDATRIYARRERYAVPALDKAMEVLDLLGGSAPGLTVSEIGEKLGRSVGEIYRVVMSLEDIQLIRREEGERDRYGLSLTLFEWAHRNLPTERLPKLAQPVMDRVALETKQSCQLAVWQEFSVLPLASLLARGISARQGRPRRRGHLCVPVVLERVCPRLAADPLAGIQDDASQPSRFTSQFTVDWAGMCALAVIIILPALLFTFAAQRYLIAGLTFGGVKG